MYRLLLLSAIIFVTACNKPKCWRCELTRAEPGSGTRTTRPEYCDKTNDEMDEIIIKNTYTTTTGNSVMVCDVKK